MQTTAKPKISVVVCTRNEESRIEDCLKGIKLNMPDEIIVVDGGSTDRTREIASKYTDVVIESKNSSLTRDRQIGIDKASNQLIAMIDSDHRLLEGDIQSLVNDLYDFDLDIVQSGLLSYKNHGFWDKAEEQTWFLVHNVPLGKRSMLGTAPAIYKKEVFAHVRFSDHITKSIDDTDFIYRLLKTTSYKVGIGRTRIRQFHFANFNTYMSKFLWYGKGDGEFCFKNPERTSRMLFHLLIRYPVLYPLRSIKKGYFNAAPFFFVQGLTRFFALSRFLIKQWFKKKQ
jgi:glycosyltransferase involved in cell wall biosynthesis